MKFFQKKPQINLENLNSFIEAAIEAVILLIIGVIPVYFSFLYMDYSVFELDKAAIFRALTEILVLLYIIKILINNKIEIRFSKWQIIAPALFFSAWTIATVFSYSPYTSFWGHYLRQQGLFMYLHYFVFFFIVLQNFNINEPKIRKRFIFVILASSLAVCLYGLAQYLGLDPIKWKKENLFFRINSTLGQPNYLGLYLLLIIPLTLYGIFLFKKTLLKAAVFLILLLQLFVLFLTYSRAAWIAFFPVIMSSVIFYLAIAKRYRLIYLILSSVFVLIAAYFLILSSGIIKYNPKDYFSVKTRIASIFVTNTGTTQNRLLNYKNAISAIGQNPFIGSGPETMWLWYHKYFNKKDLYYLKLNEYFDRTHNEFLDILVFSGLIGATGYFFLLGYIFYSGSKLIGKNLKGEHKDLLPFFLFVSILGYIVGFQFSFSVTVTNIYFWFYAALIFSLANNYYKFKKHALSFRIRKTIRISTILFLSVSVIFVVWQFNINKIRADYYFYEAIAGINSHENISTINDYFLKSLQYNPGEDFYRTQFAERVVNSFNNAVSCDFKKNILKNANEILEEMPADRLDFYARASLLKSRAYYEKCEGNLDIKQLDEDIDKLIGFSPDNVTLMVEISDLYYNLNEFERAVIKMNAVLNKLPDLDDQRLNGEQASLIKNQKITLEKMIGDSYFNLKKYKESLIFYKKALESSGYTNLELRNKIADLLIREGNISGAIKIDQHSYILSGHQTFYLNRIMIDYLRMGDLPKSKKYAVQILELDKNNKDAKEIFNKKDK